MKEYPSQRVEAYSSMEELNKSCTAFKWTRDSKSKPNEYINQIIDGKVSIFHILNHYVIDRINPIFIASLDNKLGRFVMECEGITIENMTLCSPGMIKKYSSRRDLK